MELSSLPIEELEQILEEYPWFTLARREYVLRHRSFGDEALKCAAAAAGLFFSSRRQLLDDLIEKPEKKDGTGKNGEPQESPKVSYYVVGGDYFGKDDFRELENSGDAFDVSALKYNPIASTLNSMESAEPSSPERKPVEIDEPCTETLAGIYLQQQLYDKAIAIYEKLILLYPEKNTYFANLIEEAKKIKQ